MAVFGMGISKLPERWWSPPSPPDMQANICAQTSQDSEKEFHSCAHLRLGRLALTPSPPRGMEGEGRGALLAPPAVPHWGGELDRGAGWGKGAWCHPPRSQRGHWHTVSLAVAGGFAYGHPWGSTPGFALGCQAACGPPGTGKAGENPDSLHAPSGSTPAEVALTRPFAQQRHGAFPAAGGRAGCGGRGEQHVPGDVYWQFANGKKRAPRGAGAPSSRWLGRGSARAEGPLLPGTPRAPLCPFPRPRGQLGPEQTGLFAHAGISRSLCSFDFLLPLYRTLLWGLQRGLGPPSLSLETQVCFPCPPQALTSWGCPLSTSGWPVGTAAVSPVCTPPPPAPPLAAWHLRLPSAPWRSGCERPPPCSGIPGTLHPVRRGGKLGTRIQPAVQPHGPHRASCPLTEPCPPWPEPPGPPGDPEPPSLPPPLHSAQHPWIGARGHMGGQQQGLPAMSPSAPLARAADAGMVPASRITSCPPARAPAAHQLLARLERSVLE